MPDDTEIDTAALLPLTADIVSAFVSNNRVSADELPTLIASVYAAFNDVQNPKIEAALVFNPAVTARKSLASRDTIVSMIDGKGYSTLKRHLSNNGLTPQEYRERYNLPSDYPMVAPGYSDRRRAIANELGLGRKKVDEAINAAADVVAEELAPDETPEVTPKAKRGRKPKAAEQVVTSKPADEVAAISATEASAEVDDKTAPKSKRGRPRKMLSMAQTTSD